MVDLATLLVSSCSIYVSLVFFGVCGSSDAFKALCCSRSQVAKEFAEKTCKNKASVEKPPVAVYCSLGLESLYC